MSDTDLAFDLAPVVFFGLAAILFFVRWLGTGQELFLSIGLVLGLATVYTGYRVRSLYIL